MEYNRSHIGKVRHFNENTGVGEIVTSNGVYMFTLDDIKTPGLKDNDLVKFRAELIHSTKKAYFVTKIQPSYKLEELHIHGQTYRKRRGNDE